MGRHVIRTAENTPLQVEMDGQPAIVIPPTATASAGAATLNKRLGVVTSESITTAAAADYTLTLANSTIAASSVVLASASITTAGGEAAVTNVAVTAGQVVIKVRNIAASGSFAGPITIAFVVF